MSTDPPPPLIKFTPTHPHTLNHYPHHIPTHWESSLDLFISPPLPNSGFKTLHITQLAHPNIIYQTIAHHYQSHRSPAPQAIVYIYNIGTPQFHNSATPQPKLILTTLMMIKMGQRRFHLPPPTPSNPPLHPNLHR